VGCRTRASTTELVRVTAAGDRTPVLVTPDVSGSAPGRGAHLHPTIVCLDLAERRRAFGRALRVEGAADVRLVRRLIEERSNSMSSQPAT
jgi:hypothetical protein